MAAALNSSGGGGGGSGNRYYFHSICGTRVELSNSNRRAERIQAKSDFNNGLTFSHKTLDTNVIFQVKLDKKVGLWSGSIELGVTTMNPDTFTREELPQNAIELRGETWLMSSRTIIKDGEALIENYGFDLETLAEGDTVGLMRTAQGGLVFFVNGTSQGFAAEFIPADVYVICNLYGKCAQVSLVDVDLAEQRTNTIEYVIHEEVSPVLIEPMGDNNNESDKLRFHDKCGPLVKLSSNNKVAERRRPMEEFNNAVVLTHRPLRENELFQIRIDVLIRKWSGSIEFGLITQNPETFEFPATMTVMRDSGTVVMSGNGILHDGKAANSPYTHFNLDQLDEGDRIGILKKPDGEIHYFVNGTDQGIATTGLTRPVWGAINLYGMAAKVTVVERNEREEHNLRVNVRSYDYGSISDSDDILLFHQNCGFHAAVINNGRTAHRPNASEDFNHGVVLTNRRLRPNELFEVVLDRVIPKWAGSIEIGVTTHMPTQLDYPCTMTNLRSGTWMMTGNGIMHNGTSVVDEYGESLDRLKVGDRVGVLRKESGSLHFFVNGEDQGPATMGVPSNIYGVIDLYGQAAQATIILPTVVNEAAVYYEAGASVPPENKATVVVTECGGGVSEGSGALLPLALAESYFYESDSSDIRFHSLCGKNARVSNNGLTGSRPNALGEFNAAIVLSNRPLRDNELFEVVIERMVDRWSGNIEAGLTSIRPEDLVFPNTMTDMEHDTFMLSGASIHIGGETVTNRYNCNLDTLTCGSRVGMMRKSDGSLHYFVNGEDQGVAALDVPSNMFAVVDLYGQCAQVTITRFGEMSMISSQLIESLSHPISPHLSHKFSNTTGKNILLKNNNLVATRIRHYTHGLVFSSLPLEPDETFEVRVEELRPKWAGSIMIGVTTMAVLGSDDASPSGFVPHTMSAISDEIWFFAGSSVMTNKAILKENYSVNLGRLGAGDRLGVRITPDRTLKLFINGEDMGVAAQNMPPTKKLWAVVDLFGSVETISVSSRKKSAELNDGKPNQEASDADLERRKLSPPVAFDEKCGKQIELSEGNRKARRKSGYNHGIVLSTHSLAPESLFQVKLGPLNPKLSFSLSIGVIQVNNLEQFVLPASCVELRKSSWVIYGESVLENGVKRKGKYGPNLSCLLEGYLVGVLVDKQSNLHLYVNGIDQGVAAVNVPWDVRAIVDVYGTCEEVTIVGIEEIANRSMRNSTEQNLQHSYEKRQSFVDMNHIIMKCEYMDACIRFKNTLCLPEPYFVATECVACYCWNCHRMRQESAIQRHGDPPSAFALPLGWVRFPVNFTHEAFSSGSAMMSSSTSSLSNVLTTWHVAYHGLKIPEVRRCMDAGVLLGEAEFGEFGYEAFPARKTKDGGEKADGPLLILSPSVEYASIPEFSKRYDYVDRETKKKVSSRVCFQVLVQPGSYKLGPPSYPNPITTAGFGTEGGGSCSSPTPLALDPETLEWETKEQGATHVSALLVSLDRF